MLNYRNQNTFSIATFTKELHNTSAWMEYKTLTELVFGKGE
jgi:hypothetical protein